jgi:alpha-D-ribose 1-methylphosphonate 5-phosphate C-P lyase
MKNTLLFILGLFFISCTKNEKKKEIPSEKINTKDTIIAVKHEVVENNVIEKNQLVFKVQIAALKKKNEKFTNLENVTTYQENAFTKYRLGNFKTYQEARNYRNQLGDSYPGAFVQALRNDVAISITAALED